MNGGSASQPAPGKTADPRNLPWHAHAVAGWPWLLAVVGGMIGGGCGGLAYALSLRLIIKQGVSARSYALAMLIGFGAVLIFLAAVAGLAAAFPQLRNY